MVSCGELVKAPCEIRYTDRNRSQIIRIAPHSGTVIHYSLLKSIIGLVDMKKEFACRD